MRRDNTEIKFFLENLISGWTGCAVRALQIVLFKQVLNDYYSHANF